MVVGYDQMYKKKNIKLINNIIINYVFLGEFFFKLFTNKYHLVKWRKRAVGEQSNRVPYYGRGGRWLMWPGLVLTTVCQVLGSTHGWVKGPSVSVVSVFLGIVRVGDYFVRLVSFVGQQLLDSDDDSQDEGELADDKSLECQEGKTTDGQWDECDGLHLQHHQQRHQHLLLLLLLATGCKLKSLYECMYVSNEI